MCSSPKISPDFSPDSPFSKISPDSSVQSPVKPSTQRLFRVDSHRTSHRTPSDQVTGRTPATLEGLRSPVTPSGERHLAPRFGRFPERHGAASALSPAGPHPTRGEVGLALSGSGGTRAPHPVPYTLGSAAFSAMDAIVSLRTDAERTFAVVGGGRLRALAGGRTTEGRITSVDASTGRPGALASTYASNVRVCVVAAWSMLRGRTGRVVGVVDGELLVALDGDAGPPLRFGRAALETEDTCD